MEKQLKTVPIDLLLDYIRRNKKTYSSERALYRADNSPRGLKTVAYCHGAADLLDELEYLLKSATTPPKASSH